MIKEKTLSFGYGDVIVSHTFYPPALTFRQSKSRYKCGSSINFVSAFVGSPITVTFDSMDEYSEFIRSLGKVDSNTSYKFEFKEVTFDFSKYNADSVKMLKHQANAAMFWSLSCAAC